MEVGAKRETLKSLRSTLVRLQEMTDPAADPVDIAYLKQILQHRIAELEAAEASHLPVPHLPKRAPF